MNPQSPPRLPVTAALVIIDVQQAIDNPCWAEHGPRNNPAAEDTMATLLAAWRQAGRPVFHIRHESTEPDSTYRPGQAGCDFKACVLPAAGETVLAKSAHSAFIGTGLEERLRAGGIDTLVIFGVITNNSVEATVRMAGNLGFAAWLVEDACFTFARPDYRGRLCSADEIHAMSLANLDGEYCRVVTAGELLPHI